MVQEEGGGLRLVAISDSVSDVLKLSKLHAVFTIEED